MYSKLDLIQIFFNCKNVEEFVAVCDSITWLINNDYMAGSEFLYKISSLAFDKL